jgi:hypothetical protein
VVELTDIRRTQLYPHTCSWPQSICKSLVGFTIVQSRFTDV